MRRKNKKRLNFNKLKKEFKKEWRFISFKLLIISAILLIIVLKFFRDKKILFITSFIFWIGAFTYYEIINKRLWEKKNVFQKLYSSYILILNLIFFGLYLSFAFRLTVFSIYFLLSSMALVFLISTIYSFVLLLGSKDNLFVLIITYIFLIFTTIVLFGYGFAFLSGFDGEGISQVSKENLISWDYVYFSSNIFYSMTLEDFAPIGWKTKLLSQIELILSAIIHVIVLGDIVSARLKKKNRSQKS